MIAFSRKSRFGFFILHYFQSVLWTEDANRKQLQWKVAKMYQKAAQLKKKLYRTSCSKSKKTICVGSVYRASDLDTSEIWILCQIVTVVLSSRNNWFNMQTFFRNTLYDTNKYKMDCNKDGKNAKRWKFAEVFISQRSYVLVLAFLVFCSLIYYRLYFYLLCSIQNEKF